MTVGGIGNALIAFSIFDAWENSMQSIQRNRGASGVQNGGDPLIQAAFDAFNQYAATVETQNAGMIAGLSAYIMNTQGTGAKLITQNQQAPLLAAGLMA